MTISDNLFPALIALATISPILTLLHLWQLKEWRWDRLLDHLRAEGFLSSVVSTSRVIIGVIWVSILQIYISNHFGTQLYPDEFYVLWPLMFPFALIVVSTVQLVTKKQPKPVWTQKATLMFLVSLCALIIMTYFVTNYTVTDNDTPRMIIKNQPYEWLAYFIPYLSPLFVLFAWLLLQPIDHILKQRILRRAKASRTAHPHLTVIGITGSVGKTTTKELLKHLLEPLGAIATPLHVNTEMGVASWLTHLLQKEPPDATTILIVEMGAYRKGEIALLAQIAQPTIGVLTFVGKQHSGLFGGEENIARAKGELLASLPKNGQAFINADSPLLDILKQSVVSEATYIGTDQRASIRALDIEETSTGISFVYEDHKLEIPLAGTHNVTNILLAVCVAQSLGMSVDDISQRLRSFRAFQKTFQRREENGIVILDNTYNASVESFLAGISWAEKQRATERVLLFDGIIELGDDEERLHRMIAEKAAKIFERAYVVHARFLPYFQPFFGDRVMIIPKNSTALSAGTLLVCMGRMSPKIIEKFIRNEK